MVILGDPAWWAINCSPVAPDKSPLNPPLPPLCFLSFWPCMLGFFLLFCPITFGAFASYYLSATTIGIKNLLYGVLWLQESWVSLARRPYCFCYKGGGRYWGTFYLVDVVAIIYPSAKRKMNFLLVSFLKKWMSVENAEVCSLGYAANLRAFMSVTFKALLSL